MKKILFITNIPSPYRVDFFNELGKYVDLTVLFEAKNLTNRNRSWTENVAQAFKEIYLNDDVVEENAKGYKSVLQYIDKDKYDLIIASEYGCKTLQIAIRYMKRKRIPFILNADGLFVRENENFLKKFYKKMLVSSASWWITSGEYSANSLVYYGSKKDNIFVYPFTSIRESEILLLDSIEKQALRRELGLSERKIVLCVGQFIYRKGMDILLEVAAANRDKDFYLIGGEPTFDYTEIIKKYELTNVNFIKHLNKDNLAKYYQCADIFAMPTREDVWGLVVNEAMAKGLPVITTKRCIAGLAMVKDGENGYLVEVDDVDTMAEKINILCSDDQMLQEMSKKAIQTAQQYTIENMAKKHNEIFDIIIDKKYSR